MKLLSLSSLAKTLIYLIPFFLITGPFLSDLAVTLVVLIFLYIIFKEKDFYIFNNVFFYLFILFYFYISFNSLINNQNLDSLRISFTYFRFGIFSLAIMYFLNKDFNLVFLKKIFYCLLFCFIILIFDGAIQFIFGQNLFGFDLIYPGPRVSSFFGEELVLGSYLSRLFPILFGLYIFFYSSKKKLYYLFLLSFLTILLILTSGERTALFLSILSFLLIFLLIYENNKFLKKFFYSIIFFVIVILSVSETLRTRIVDVTINEMFLSDNNDKKIRIFTRQHEEHYISALRMFQMSPILGVGVKNFRNFCDKKEFKISDYTCSPHPHNTYIQIISETGLLGFMIILIVFFGINYKMFKHFLSSKDGRPIFKDLEICLLVSIYLTLWPLTPSGNFFNNWISIIYYYPVGIFMWSINRKSKN